MQSRILAACRVVFSGMVLSLGACAVDDADMGTYNESDVESDNLSSFEEEGDETIGSTQAALNGTGSGTLNSVYKLEAMKHTCLGGTNNGRSCTSNTDCPSGTCALNGQRCAGGTNHGNVCSYHSQCPGKKANGTRAECYTQGVKLWNSATTLTSFSIRMGNHSDVKLVTAAPSNGRYRVEHGTLTGSPAWGWVDAASLSLHHVPAPALSATRTNALMRGRSAMGFSYWWGHGLWSKAGPTVTCESNGTGCVSNAGRCIVKAGFTGCKECTHQATGPAEYGADCSGFVSTIWGYQDDNPETEHSQSGFSTAGFMKEMPNNWTTVSVCATPQANCAAGATCHFFRSALAADAVVKTGHIFLVAEPRNAASRIKSYECRGCNFGCMPFYRDILDGDPHWKTIRRKGWPANG